jgi:predicted nuclease of predicted toxin-antitoxin system
VKFLFDHDVPDDLGHVLRHLGHDLVLLREVLPGTTADREVLAYAAAHELIVVTCNRDDFVALADAQPHRGLIVLFRRKTRTAERAALVRLLENAGEQGLIHNINFA